ncbi:MAG TPA: beta-L-arabinofuranosidase domain-containing protein [Tepidisphaeraceae bacterium]|jgi:hypothetical protein
MKTIPLILAVMLAATAQAQLTPVPFTAVRFTDNFWAPRLEKNRSVTIPHNFKTCEATGRISNFTKAAGKMPGGHEGYFFNDSDLYKALEGAAYSLALHPDPALDKQCDAIIADIAAAQREDGYIYTFYTLRNELDKRFTNLKDQHEMYCAGHLIEAAVAHHQATGKRNFLDVAVKLANYLDSVFGPEKKHQVDGHEEIEIALFKLARESNDDKYSKLASFFLSIRGTDNGRKKWGPYYQDDTPIQDMQEVHGHAVRMMYLMCAATDAAAAGNEAYRSAVERLWDNMVRKKMYITGGVGARHEGEAFGDAYELPNETAYNETCAAIGNALWSHRMNLLFADAKYADVVEQVIYNGFLSGWGLSGDKFFYVNPLASNGKHHREPWYPCACCPPNVIRFIPQLQGMAYATSQGKLFVNLYGSSEARIGKDVRVRQEANYPWDEIVKLHVDSRANPLAVHLRIPGWCKGASIKVNGERTELKVSSGYAILPERKWDGESDTIELRLPMPIERVKADPQVKADEGRVALRRGPIVYCAEAVDDNNRVSNLILSPDAKLQAEHRDDLLGGVTIIKGNVQARQQEDQPVRGVEFQAVPYYAWDHRGAGEMAVWLAEDVQHARPLRTPTIANTSKASASHVNDSLEALSDDANINSSHDREIPRFTWWDHKGTSEWVQYDFEKPATISATEVYFFDDTSVGGHCAPPQSWKLLFKDGDEWKPVEAQSDYPVAVDQFSGIRFTPVTTSALRLQVQLQPNASAGVLEWRVK